HTRFSRDWSSDVCSSDLQTVPPSLGGRRLMGAWQVSWLPDHRQPSPSPAPARWSVEGGSPVTVAGPLGIPTRFPILRPGGRHPAPVFHALVHHTAGPPARQWTPVTGPLRRPARW